MSAEAGGGWPGSVGTSSDSILPTTEVAGPFRSRWSRTTTPANLPPTAATEVSYGRVSATVPSGHLSLSDISPRMKAPKQRPLRGEPLGRAPRSSGRSSRSPYIPAAVLPPQKIPPKQNLVRYNTIPTSTANIYNHTPTTTPYIYAISDIHTYAYNCAKRLHPSSTPLSTSKPMPTPTPNAYTLHLREP